MADPAHDDDDAGAVMVAEQAPAEPGVATGPPAADGEEGAGGELEAVAPPPAPDETLAFEGPECPLCGGTGHLAILPRDDPHTMRCPDCDGMGQTFTGSRVAESSLRGCPTCAGAGWVDKPPPPYQPPPDQPPPYYEQPPRY